ncbi:MAG: aldo/keto reductase [Clostridia bacterium]|nr:aldo/keto reductase [Clostridia bacterium]
MEFVKINDTEIPQVVIGTWSWGEGLIGGGGIFGNKTDARILREVFVSAVRNGFTLYDTAEIYSNGESEKIIGELTDYYNGKVEIEPGQKKKVQISTKYMPRFVENKTNVVKSVLGSLERTKQESIDIFWLHHPRYYKKLLKAIIPLVKEGKIKNIGVSNFNLKQAKDAKRILEKEGIKLAGCQNHLSLIYQDCIKTGMLDWCKENDIKFFAYMIMEQGALSGKYTKDNPLPSNSLRGKTYTPHVLEKLEPLFDEMKKLSEQYGVAVSQIPVAWALSKGTVPIIGATKQQHIYELTKAFDAKLKKEDIWVLENIASKIKIHKKGFWEPKQK